MGSCTDVDTRVNQKIIYVMSYFSEYHDSHMINEIYQGLKDINYVFNNHRRFDRFTRDILLLKTLISFNTVVK